MGEQLRTVLALPRVAWQTHSGSPFIRRLLKSARFSAYNLRSLDQYIELRGLFDCPQLSTVLNLCPGILEKPHSSYVCADWVVAERYDQIISHFRLMKSLFGDDLSQIYQPQGYQLFSFVGHENESYTVELFPGYQNEGSVGIRIRDAEEREVYALSLHFVKEVHLACYIGALQGPNDRIPDRQQTIISITRGLHGLRPKALMLEVLYMVAASLEIECIFGVSNSGNIYQSEDFKSKNSQISFDRDALWQEYQARQISPQFFLFPDAPIRKDLSALKSAKRSLYRKRYAWLDMAAIDTDNAMNQLLGKSMIENPIFEEPRRAA